MAGGEAGSVSRMKYLRRFHSVNGGSLRRILNVDCIGLIAHVENLISDDVRSLDCTPEGTVPSKYVRGGGQVLQNESGCRCMPGRRYGSKLSNLCS